MNKQLKEKLEYHYTAFDRSKIEPDPLQFLHLYNNPVDIELIGFIASVFAYGNVTQINKTINKLISVLGAQPSEFLLNSNKGQISKKMQGIIHRFYSEDDVVVLFLTLHDVLKKHGSLGKLFMQGYKPQNVNLKNEISLFNQSLHDIIKKNGFNISRGVAFMFPDPEKGSACKRMNLFLRWMVRKDELDFGLWNEIPASKLLIPVDTHIANICKKLKLTSRKNADWKMAEEITANLRKFDPLDPVKYDFAICHIGMRKLEF